jgi:integrase
MPAMTHLWEHPRSRVYWYRRAIPKSRRASVGRSEFKRSLGTTNLAEAKQRCSEVDAEFNRLVFGGSQVAAPIEIDIDKDLTLREAEDIALRWRERLIEIEYSDVLLNPVSEESRVDAIFRTDEDVARLKTLIAKNQYDEDVVPNVLAMLVKDEGLESRMSSTSEGLLRAALTRAWLDARIAAVQFRRGNMDFRPKDRLFFPRANGNGGASNYAIPAANGRSAELPAETAENTLEESFKGFLKEWQKPKKTLHEMKATVRLFMELMGSDRRTATIEKPHIEQFKNALSARPRAMTAKQRALSLPELLKTLDPDGDFEKVTPTTVGKAISFLNSFLDWCERNGHIAKNPAVGMKPPGWKRTHSRLPFSSTELQRIFSAPIFIGCESAAKWWEPGKVVAEDERYWIPLLGWYSGARPAELGQLLVSDIKHHGSITYFEINTINPHSDDPEDAKRVKTWSSERVIVVHPDLIRFGFLDYVERIRRAGHKHLFPGLVNEKGEVQTDAFSKWFARFLERLGITDRRKVFYSFRHGFEDALRDAERDAEMRNVIMGHADKATRARYGRGHLISEVHKAVRRIKFEGVDLPHLIRRRRSAAKS